MQSIQLTQEHKDKLLEMCKVLFPEYNYFYITYQNGNSDASDNAQRWVNCTDRKGKEITIHWFEFCMIHLIERLNDKLDWWEDIPPYVSNVYGEACGKWNVYTKFHFLYPKAIHGGSIVPRNPIDFLYEEFKRLK